ncbi:unnamed protein product [Schistocephalus solidus]|uniref:DEAD domain-containing protein n=1 Tax=Schistocephalus solidus TaxID=70667 RepID=A0A183SES3_SCHSO|nr:unnamed protein product [Schistocephalus solidus]
MYSFTGTRPSAVRVISDLLNGRECSGSSNVRKAPFNRPSLNVALSLGNFVTTFSKDELEAQEKVRDGLSEPVSDAIIVAPCGLAF